MASKPLREFELNHFAMQSGILPESYAAKFGQLYRLTAPVGEDVNSTNNNKKRAVEHRPLLFKFVWARYCVGLIQHSLVA